jgi:lipopolysaccharide/colanic/teichoic acid biosynthesis glycosyltransferase
MSAETAATDKARSAGLPRAVEIPLALVGLLLAAPVIGLAAVAVVVTSGFPVFFRQTRVGRDGVPFRLIKLRTMRSSKGAPRVTARGDSRVTLAGAGLRRTKIDELPELWNVLRGDMAFVGPRPEVPDYVDLSDPRWREVLRARPGLTDPMTLRLRDEETLMAGVTGDRERFYRETLQPWKLQGYAEYLQRRNWLSDLRVLLQTAFAIWVPGRPTPAPHSKTELYEGPPRP